tara:strand:- start:278 stop:592 length:315 start_codon:yes stop_codon:yes gene_type:complete
MGYKFKFSNNRYTEGEYSSKVIANVSGDKLRQGTGSSTVANLDSSRKKVRKGTGSTTLCNIYGDDIREGTGSSRIGKVSKDVVKTIKNSTGSPMDVAFWYLFVK